MPASEPNAARPHGVAIPVKPDVILLNGTSSAGKSSIARALQRRAGIPLYHVSLDTFTDMFLWEAITDPAEKQRCHGIGVNNFHQALVMFAKGSFGMVVDHLILGPEWDKATRAALAGRRVFFIGVRCPLAVIEARERARPDRHPGMAAGQFGHVHRHQVYDFEVDTSLATPEECADLILAFIRNRAA
jgi:chloramphenicol 3-O phosphotransferase